MLRLRRTRWLCAILVAPVLAFAVTASSYLALRCAMTGTLVASSCCPDPATAPEDVPAPEPDSMAGAPCCDPTVVSTDKLPTLMPDRASIRVVLAAVTAPVALAAPQVALRPRAARGPVWRDERTSDRSSAPRYVLTHAFLI
jgi:hypothetical protein